MTVIIYLSLKEIIFLNVLQFLLELTSNMDSRIVHVYNFITFNANLFSKTQ